VRLAARALIAAATTGARPLPGVAYTSPDIFALEQERIFATHWLCVGRSDEVELPGQWLREIVAGAPILVVRGADLRLRAFHDVCRHRGASLVGRKDCGRDARFICPYHGWTYALDGRGATATLLDVRVEVWEGFVFVTLGATTPLREAMGETPPWLAELTPLRRARRTTAIACANWKLLVENFQESHHFPGVHPALEALTPTASAESWLGDGSWLGGIMPIRGETVSGDGLLRDRKRIGPRTAVHDAMLFPTLLTSVQPDYLLTYRLIPLSAGETRIVADIYFHPASPETTFGEVFAFWDQVNAEDRAICEDQQQNAHSPGFAPIAYMPVEEGVLAFDRLYATRSEPVR